MTFRLKMHDVRDIEIHPPISLLKSLEMAHLPAPHAHAPHCVSLCYTNHSKLPVEDVDLAGYPRAISLSPTYLL